MKSVIGRTPNPKKKSKQKSFIESIEEKENVYAYGAAICNLNSEPASVLKFYSRKMISPTVLFQDIDSGIDGYEPNPHVTVMYGFHDDENRVADVCQNFGSIPINFGHVSKFDANPLFDVIKVDIDSESLFNLNHLLGQYCNVEELYNEFIPHATLAYVQKGSCDHLIGDDFFIGLDDLIDMIHFSAKDGMEHPINL